MKPAQFIAFFALLVFLSSFPAAQAKNPENEKELIKAAEHFATQETLEAAKNSHQTESSPAVQPLSPEEEAKHRKELAKQIQLFQNKTREAKLYLEHQVRSDQVYQPANIGKNSGADASHSAAQIKLVQEQLADYRRAVARLEEVVGTTVVP